MTHRLFTLGLALLLVSCGVVRKKEVEPVPSDKLPQKIVVRDVSPSNTLTIDWSKSSQMFVTMMQNFTTSFLEQLVADGIIDKVGQNYRVVLPEREIWTRGADKEFYLVYDDSVKFRGGNYVVQTDTSGIVLDPDTVLYAVYTLKPEYSPHPVVHETRDSLGVLVSLDTVRTDTMLTWDVTKTPRRGNRLSKFADNIPDNLPTQASFATRERKQRIIDRLKNR